MGYVFGLGYLFFGCFDVGNIDLSVLCFYVKYDSYS